MSQFTMLVLFILFGLMLLTLVKMLKNKKKHFWISSIVGTMFFSFFFTGSSLFWTTDIAYDRETLQHLEFGWPVSFQIQNQEKYDPPFPYVMDYGWGLSSNVPNYPANQISLKNFYLSLFINFLGTLLIWILVSFYLRSRDDYKNIKVP